MRYWWVNQNQTFRQEIEGGYPTIRALPKSAVPFVTSLGVSAHLEG